MNPDPEFEQVVSDFFAQLAASQKPMDPELDGLDLWDIYTQPVEAVHKRDAMTDLEREELETYRMRPDGGFGQIAAYYLLAEELGVKPNGSVVDTVTAIVKERDALKKALTDVVDGWVDTNHGFSPDVPDLAMVNIDAMTNAANLIGYYIEPEKRLGEAGPVDGETDPL